MTTRLPAVILGLLVVLAAWGYVEAIGTGLEAPAALSGAESAAAPKEKAAQPAGQSAAKSAPAPAATPAADPEAARRAAQEKERLVREYARTRRTVTSRLSSRKAVEFEQTSIKNILEYLAEIGKFSIVFDKALEEAGLDLETRTASIRVTGITYEKAIELVLPRECGYQVGPGYVLITTLEKSWLPLKTASYSVRLALATVPDFTNAPRFEIGDVTQAAASAAQGGGFGNLFGSTTTAEPEDTGKATPERIIDMVQKFVNNQGDRHIAPWADEGGPATIEYLNGQLIISQTEHGHRAIRRLLAMIE